MSVRRTAKEVVYDEQISPLMMQIIAICQASGIAMVMQFDIGDKSNVGLTVSSQLTDENGLFPPNLQPLREGDYIPTPDRPNAGYSEEP